LVGIGRWIKRGRGMTHVVEHLPIKLEALSSNPSTAKKKKKKKKERKPCFGLVHKLRMIFTF
jgi:hypothetical protein